MITTLGSFTLCVGSQADYQLETLNNWSPSRRSWSEAANRGRKHDC